jgi:hypothetical protein
MVQAGAVLTAAVIERLRDLGIDSVSIEGQGGRRKPLDVALRELHERFRGHERDAWMMELKTIVRDLLSSSELLPPDHA